MSPSTRFLLGHTERAVEWLSALCMLGWAVVLAQPGNTFQSGPLQEFLRFGLSEAQFAAAFGAVGALRIGALYINGRWPRTPIVRMIGSTFGVLLWGQAALALIQAWSTTGVASTGIAVYVALAGGELLSIYRAAFDARYQRR